MALTRKELDPMVCATPGCTHETHSGLVLVGRCHPGAGTLVRYFNKNGVLEITCKVCGKVVVNISVARQ